MARVSLILVFILLVIQAEARRIKGVIIRRDDSLQVLLNIPFRFLAKEPNYEQLQYRVTWYDRDGIRHVIKPDDAKEIDFATGGESIRMLSVPDLLNGFSLSARANIFLRLMIDGRLKMFAYYFTQSSPGVYNGNTGISGGAVYNDKEFVLQKGNGPLEEPSGLSFRKEMMEYLADCPDIVSKIDERAFHRSDLEALVIYYNSHCAPSTP